MDLWCEELTDCDTYLERSSDETATESVREEKDCLPASEDLAILNNDCVLDRLLETEARYVPKPADRVYNSVQNEVEPHMRTILATWMSEVSKQTV